MGRWTRRKGRIAGGFVAVALLVVAGNEALRAPGGGGVRDADPLAVGRDDAPPPLRAGGRATDGGASTDGGAAPEGDVVERRGKVRLGARWHVRVVDALDGRGVGDAVLEAEVDLVADPDTGTTRAVSAARTATTGADGTVTLERMPFDRRGAVHASAPGFVPARVALDASDAADRTVEVRLVARLPLGLATSALDLVVDGRPVEPGDATLLVALEGSAPRDVRPGAAVLVDDDPRAAASRVGVARVLVPGYAGPPHPVELTRGSRTRLDASLPPWSELTVVATDPSGAPLSGVEVGIAPAAAFGEIEARTTVRGLTDASGTMRATARFASTLAVRPRAAGRYFPLADRVVDLDGPSHRVQAVGLPLARLTLVLAGRAAPTALALAWSDVAFAPAVATAVAGDGSGGERAVALAALERTLPPRVEVDGGATTRGRATLQVLPGTFTLVASADGATSAPTSCVVPPEGAEVEVRLASLATVRFTLVGDGPTARSPFAGGLWIGHRAGFAERFDVERVLGRLWRVRPGAARDAWVASVVEASRGAPGGLAADVAAVGPTGRVEARSDGVSDEGTLMLPDGRVAIVRPAPRTGDADLPVRVDPRAFGALRVRLVDAGGRPRAGLDVVVNPLEAAAAGRRDLLLTRTTDADGAIVLGVVPGDALALRPSAGAWLPTASERAAASLEVGEGRDAIVAVRVTDGPVASVELRPAGR